MCATRKKLKKSIRMLLWRVQISISMMQVIKFKKNVNNRIKKCLDRQLLSEAPVKSASMTSAISPLLSLSSFNYCSKCPIKADSCKKVNVFRF